MTEENTKMETTEQDQPRVHGNTRKAADMSLSKREISPDAHKAVDEGRISLEEARELGREGSGSERPRRPSRKRTGVANVPAVASNLRGEGFGFRVTRLASPVS